MNSLKWFVTLLPIINFSIGGFVILNYKESDLIQISYDLVSFVLLPFFCYLYGQKYLNLNKRNLWVYWPVNNNSVTDRVDKINVFIIVTIAYLAVYSISYYFVLKDNLLTTSIYGDVYNYFENPNILTLVYLSVSAGVVQELFYKSYLLKYVEQHWGCTLTVRVVFIIFSALLFTIGHLESSYGVLIIAFISGIVTNALFIRYRYLMPFIFSHVLIDFFALK